jgi:hypothetical protein
MIRALNRVAPIVGGLGRFLIPEGKKKAPEAIRIARNIVEKYVGKVNRRIR